ncbi:hypothetical protein EMPS_09507 [Entomortierella parvispora]|uniref:FAD-binding domain-containing protein n=1 Tax=Entomortierella parvispora TaxID=205924 RepID=A0A9P3HIP3_9FUNG|nr:hypothetical protein EMPS_09507 [Entomortierella parvispora]
MASKLHVLIVGAGIGGLMLAVLLERANISYEVFEKTKENRPLGSAISLHNSLMVIFEQLGLYKDILKMTKPFGALHLRKEDMTISGSLLARPPGIDCAEHYGDYNRVIARPDLVDLLLSQIPAYKIQYNKRVLRTKQDDEKVIITCSDNMSYMGSILVGADGAYSSVRQNMYANLKKEGKLSKSDSKPLGYSYDCVVGVTSPLDPALYPIVLDEYCEFECVLGKESPYSWWLMPLTENRIGWMVTQDVRMNGTDEDRNFGFSEWGPEAALDMCNQSRHLPCPYYGTFGDLIDRTPKDRISKVMLEDKYFESWYHGRTVLLGDACHKMQPFGGQGANMAILGALQLTNLLFDIYSTSQEEITRVFKEYHHMRRRPGKTSVEGSNSTGSLLHKKGPMADMIRRTVLNAVPKWAIKIASDKLNARRDQICFLPYVEMRGKFKKSQVNPPSRRMIPGVGIPRAV